MPCKDLTHIIKINNYINTVNNNNNNIDIIIAQGGKREAPAWQSSRQPWRRALMQPALA